MGTKRREFVEEEDARRHGSSKRPSRHHERYDEDRYSSRQHRRDDRRHRSRDDRDRDDRRRHRENVSAGNSGSGSSLRDERASSREKRPDLCVEQKPAETRDSEMEISAVVLGEGKLEEQQQNVSIELEQQRLVVQENSQQIDVVEQQQLQQHEQQQQHQENQQQEQQQQEEDVSVVEQEQVQVLQPAEGKADERGVCEEDTVQGVPHTPEVQDLRFSPPSGACRIVDEFEKIGRLGEGTYGVVYQARDTRTGEVVALKRVKIHKEETEGFPVTSLREINLLVALHHPSIIGVKEVVMGKGMDSIFMVMEYLEMNLKDTMNRLKQPYDFAMVKRMMQQLLSGVAYLHENWVLHRDLKPSNILVGSQGELKLCDFGLARRYDSPIKVYTHNVVTMWYRAPELFTKEPVKYSTAIDVWSLGCIMAELILKEPLFPGTSEIDQMKRIRKLIPKVNFGNLGFLFPQQKMGSLRERILSPAAEAGMPMLSEKGFDLLARLLTFDPEKRISARDALNHPWFEEEPLPATAAQAAAVEAGGAAQATGAVATQAGAGAATTQATAAAAAATQAAAAAAATQAAAAAATQAGAGAATEAAAAAATQAAAAAAEAPQAAPTEAGE